MPADLPNPIRVILVDDHPVVRFGIRRALARYADIEVIAEAGSGEEALALVEQLKPDVLLVDMEMPGMNGVELTRQVRSQFPNVHTLALSAYEDRAYVLEILQLGASGYLTKDETTEFIGDAVKGVAQGQVGWLSRRISAQITHWMRRDEHDARTLTQREMEVLQLLVDGNTNQRMALELQISEKTIEKYIESILRKLNVRSRVEAAVYAVRNDLVRK